MSAGRRREAGKRAFLSEAAHMARDGSWWDLGPSSQGASSAACGGFEDRGERGSVSCLPLLAHQAPPSMGFSMREHWSGQPSPSPGRLPRRPKPGLLRCRRSLYRLSPCTEKRESITDQSRRAVKPGAFASILPARSSACSQQGEGLLGFRSSLIPPKRCLKRLTPLVDYFCWRLGREEIYFTLF